MITRVLFYFTLLGITLLGQGCGSLSLFGNPNDRGRLELEVLEEADRWFTTDEVLLIPLSGIVNEGGMRTYMGQPGMLVGLKDRLEAAKQNPRLKAVVLRIDTPGGTITASDLIYQEIIRFQKEKNVPVIAMLGDMAASGGLYVAMAAQEIYALPTTVTGSIGVIITLPSFKELSDKIGFEMRVMKSGRNKDIGSPWRELTPEQREIFDNLIDGYYEKFVGRILDGRKKAGLTREGLMPIADGRIFPPDVALAAGVIDGIAYPNEVFERAKRLAGIEDARIVSY